MVDLYPTLKFVHVLLAIVAVGANLTYPLWLARPTRPDHLRDRLANLIVIDKWVANPSYVLLLATGWWLARVGNIAMSTFWISTAFTLFGVLGLVGFGFASPALAKQLRQLDRFGPKSPEYRRSAGWARTWGMIAGALAVAIVAVMVYKPT